MNLKDYLVSRYGFIVALSASFLLASCGSYQYVGYDGDGIYGTEEVVYQENPNSVSTDVNSSSYYKNYFEEKENEIDAQNEIFTDIDSYEGSYTDQELVDSEFQYEANGYAGWGDNSTEIRIIDQTFYRPWFNYGGFYGWGLNNFGWGGRYPFYGSYYGSLWGRPYWGIGFGAGIYDPWFYGYGAGFGFNYGWGGGYPFYGNWRGRYPYYGRFYNGYASRYNNRYYGYNTGRRSSNVLSERYFNNRRRSNSTARYNTRNRINSNGQLVRRPRTNARNSDGTVTRSTRRSTSSTNRISRPANSNNRTVRPNTNTRPRVNSSPRRSSNTRTTAPRRSNNSIQRSSRPSRSSGSIQRSSSPRRSSGSVRSSSSSRSPSVSRSSRSSGSRSGGIRRNNL